MTPTIEPATAQPITLGAVATRYGCQLWQVRRLFERRLLPETPRVGRLRVVYPDQIPAIERALVDAGYVRPRAEALATAS